MGPGSAGSPEGVRLRGRGLRRSLAADRDPGQAGKHRMASQKKWQLSGDYFENCNCNVVCPCLISPGAPLTTPPSQGTCDVALAFHIEKGNYDGVPLDALNVVVAGHVPGPMANGDWTLAAFIGEGAYHPPIAALGAIFGGNEGGPMAAFAPLVGTHL